jgi:hypothetical protein
MKLSLRAFAGALTAGAWLLAGTPAAAAIIATTSIDVPIVDLNNPCTAGHDSIDGTLNLNAIAERDSGGLVTVRFSGRGSGADVNNLFYRFLTAGTVQFHDPLPADVLLSVRLGTSTTASNARLGLSLHVNEQGRVTDIGQSGLQCGGL